MLVGLKLPFWLKWFFLGPALCLGSFFAGLPTVAAAAALSTSEGFDYTGVLAEIKTGRLAEAKGTLDSRVSAAPGDGYAHLLLGIVLGEMNRPDEAETQFLETIRLRPRDPVPHANLGTLLASRGRVSEAVHQFESALALNPRDATSFSNLGSVQMSTQQYQEAMKSFESACRLAPEDIQPLLGLYQTQLKLGLLRAAHDTARRLLGVPGVDEQAIQIVGALQAESNDYSGAIQSFEKGIRLFPQSRALPFNLGLALQKSGQSARAETVLLSLRSQQDSAEVENVLGSVYEQNKKFLSAVQSYQRAAKMEPGNENYRFDYAFELLAHLNYEAAHLVAERAVNDFPQSVRMRVCLGVALFGLGHTGEAQDLFFATLRQFPDSELAIVYVSLCAESIDTGLAETKEALMTFYQSHPRNFMAPYLLARTALNESDPGSALPLLQASIKVRPDYAPSHFEMGRALGELSRLEEAVKEFQTALKLEPNKAETWYRLTLAYRKQGQAALADKAEREFRRLESKSQTPELVQTFLYNTNK